MKRFNDWLADRLSLVLSMMSTFYIITLLVIVPLFWTQPQGFVAWAAYLCSVIFQGIALPVLGYTARKASDKSDALMLKIESLLELIESQQIEIEDELKDLK